MTDPTEGEATVNPYQAPESDISPSASLFRFTSFGGGDSPESIRETFLAREATVRTIGLVYALMGFFTLVTMVVTLNSPRGAEQMVVQAKVSGVDLAMLRTTILVMGVSICVILLGLGLALWNLQGWARVTLLILFGLGTLGLLRLFFDPNFQRQIFSNGISSVISILHHALALFVFFSLMSSDSKAVCTRSYRAVVAQTPAIRPSPGTRDRALIGVLVLTQLFGLGFHFL